MCNAAAITLDADRESMLVRVIDAPRERVFAALTDPEQLAFAWDPHGMTRRVVDLDLRSGGAFRAMMRTSDGSEYPAAGIFLEVIAPERIVFTDAYDEGRHDAETKFTAAVVTFEEQDGKTRVVSRVLRGSAAPVV